MSNITNASPVVTEDKLKDFYEDIKPFLGCPAYLTSEGNSDYYSTDEKVIGRWTDGKPLYQKVIYFNPQITIAANSWQNIKSDETDIECIADAIILRNDGIFIPQYGNVSPFINTRGLWVYTTQLQNAIQGIILKYTKITDSVTTTIQEDPNEYSTDEKIIGKWIDGKPIYQKTFQDLNYNTALTLEQSRYTGAVNVLPSNCTLLSAEGYMILGDSSGNSMTYNKGDINFDYSDGTIRRALFSTKAGLRFISKWNDIIKSYAITLKYTKTTD